MSMAIAFIVILPVLVIGVAVVWIWAKRRRAHALHDSAAAGNLVKMEKLLASGSRLDGIYDHLSPLHRAVMQNQLEAARFLLTHGASVDLKTESDVRVSPLHIAATIGNREMAELLVERGADINIQANNFETPVLTAARFGRKDVFSFLLSSGAALDITDGNGNNMLFNCILDQDPKAVDMLLEAGMDPNCQDADNRAYALHAAMVLAIHTGQTDSVECLLKHGADPNVRDQHGMKPMKMAKIANNDDLIKLLTEYGAE